MTSFDTNLLLYSLNKDCVEYEPARAFFAALPTRPAAVAVCELVLLELYVLLRNPAVVRKPLASAEAVGLVQTFRRHPTWRLIDYPGDVSAVRDAVWQRASDTAVGRRVVFDSRLALTLRHHGVTDFATRNASDFAGFGFTQVWNPLTP